MVEVGPNSLKITVGDRVVTERLPRVRCWADQVVHLPGWLLHAGGLSTEEPDVEWGATQGFAQPSIDTGDWVGCARINEIPLGFPTWEGDAYDGYAWYRTTVDVPSDAAGRSAVLLLGSPAQPDDLGWTVFLDGRSVHAEQITAPQLELQLRAEALVPGMHSLAVRVRRSPTPAPDAVRELEGWRHVDPFCHQALVFDPGFPVIDFAHPVIEDDRVVVCDTAGEWRLTITYDGIPEGIQKSTRLEHLGGSATVVADVVLADLVLDRSGRQGIDRHPEGHWAGTGGLLVAGIDPAAVTVATEDGIACLIWPRVTLQPGAMLDLPLVVLAETAEGDHGRVVHDLLSRLGRPPTRSASTTLTAGIRSRIRPNPRSSWMTPSRQRSLRC